MVDESTTPEIIIEARKPVRGMPRGFPEKTTAAEPSNRLLHAPAGRLARAAAPPLSPAQRTPQPVQGGLVAEQLEQSD